LLQLDWLGWDADKVGKAPKPSRADGAPGHHLQLKVQLGSGQEITAIGLRAADEQGGSSEDELRWSTLDTAAEYLAAEIDGRRLNPRGAKSLGRHSGAVVFDLYAHDIGQWDVHRIVYAEVLLSNGSRIAGPGIFMPPPDRLLGIWQMHCATNAPGAFEPMTMSGRIQLIWQADDSIIGHFDGIPTSGKLGKDGKIEGFAEDSSTRVIWHGELENPTRGRPLRGGGGFRFEQSSEHCTGEGMWGNR
jgi:hypothetical protein